MLFLRSNGSAARGETLANVRAERREGHLAEPREQNGLGIPKGAVESGIHGFLDEAAGRLRPVTRWSDAACVSVAFARSSEVVAPSFSAMCSKTWSTPESRLSRFM